MMYRQTLFSGVIQTDKVDVVEMKEENCVSVQNVNISTIGELSNKIGFEKHENTALAGDVMLVHQLGDVAFAIAGGKIYKF